MVFVKPLKNMETGENRRMTGTESDNQQGSPARISKIHFSCMRRSRYYDLGFLTIQYS